MENKKVAQENLEFIKQVILDSKKMIREKGDIAILWGIVIIIAQLGSFYLIRTQQYQYIGIMWIIVIASGWVLTFILAKNKGRSGVTTSAIRIDSATWISTGMSMTIVGFAGSFSGMISGYSINGLMAMFLGNAFFITGMIYSSKIFKYAAFGWWIGGTILFWIRNEYTFLIFAAMMLLFQTVPGIMLYIKYKKEEAK